MGLVRADDRIGPVYARVELTKGLEFATYTNPISGSFAFVGTFGSQASIPDVVLSCKILSLRVQNYHDALSRQSVDLAAQMKVASLNSSVKRSRQAELGPLRNRLMESKIVLFVDNASEVKKIKSQYKKSCKDMAFTMPLEVISQYEAKAMLGITA